MLINVLALILAFALKAFYSRAGADQLLWILAPSAWLARFAGGIDLVYEKGAGFISHTHHLVVGPSCAGLNFLVICFLCLYFSFARRFPQRLRWLAYSVLIAFAATIVANGLRIFLSAHLWNAGFYLGWMTPEGMHRLIGIVVYYSSLLALYFALEYRFGAKAFGIAPLLWYLAVSIGIPFAGRLYANGVAGFDVHAAWVAGIAVILTSLKALSSVLRNRIQCGS